MKQVPNQIKIDLNKSTDIACNSCGGTLFTQAIKFKKISKLLTGTPEDAIIPIEVFKCECGEVLNELLPPEMR